MLSTSNSQPLRSQAVHRRNFLKLQAVACATLISGRPSIASATQEPAPPTAPAPLRVRVWCEGTAPAQVYPNEIDGAIAEGLRVDDGLKIATGRLEHSDAGLSDA